MMTYTRTELSKRTGVSQDTLRFYETCGMIPLPARSQNNYRQYDDHAVERLLFIRQAKRCGFSLKEIRQTLELIENESAGECTISTDDVIDLKIEKINERIRELETMRQMLQSAKEALRGKDCSRLSSYFGGESDKSGEYDYVK